MTDFDITLPGSWPDGSWLQASADFDGRNSGLGSIRSPWALVDGWESLVGAAEAGYEWTIYEFEGELRVRDFLAKMLADEELGRFAPMAVVRERVQAADARLNRAFLPQQRIRDANSPWWRRGVLAVSGDEYTGDVQRIYGMVVRRAPAGDVSPAR